MLKQMKLGTQITAGFGAILLVLIVVAAISYTGLQSTVDNFGEFQRKTENTSLTQQIQAEMLESRLAVVKYMMNHDEASTQAYKNSYSTLMSLVEEAKRAIRHPERAEKVRHVAENLLIYNKHFERIITLIQERNKTVDEVIFANAVNMRKSMDQLIEAIYHNKDPQDEVDSRHATLAQRSLLYGNIFANRYLVTNLQEDQNRAAKVLEEFNGSIELLGNGQDNEQQQLIKQLKADAEAYALGVKNIGRIITERNKLIEEINKIGPSVGSSIDEIQATYLKEQKALQQEVDVASTQTLNVVLGVALVSLVLGMFLAWFLIRMIKKPIGGEPAEMAQIAQELANGNLQITFSHTEGATGVYAAMYEMTMSLRDIVLKVLTATDTINSASREIAAGNLNLSQRTEEQAASLEETASSMEELTSTVKQNADNAAQANQLAAEARRQAESGGTVVEKAVSAMAEINAASKKIADIIDVIDEIAFQTNLLALNAAVEAARAGEQGRGFAVVAAEVRKLAQRSADAAKEISDLIRTSVAKVEEGSRLVNDSGSALSDIMASVKKVTDIVAEIASASREQSTGIEQVNRAVVQMDEVTQQNAALVEEAAASAKALEEQASELRQMMGFFNIDEGHKSHVTTHKSDHAAAPSKPTVRAPVASVPAAKKPSPMGTKQHAVTHVPHSPSAKAPLVTHSPKKVVVKPAPAQKQHHDDEEWEEF